MRKMTATDLILALIEAPSPPRADDAPALAQTFQTTDAIARHCIATEIHRRGNQRQRSK